MRFVDSDYLRKELAKRQRAGTQAELAERIGIKPQNLSVMLKGGPIYGKALEFLGYEPVKNLYRKIEGASNDRADS